MFSIKPRQRAGEKGAMFKLVKSRFSEVHCEHYSKNSELIYNAKKMCKCLWGTSARRTGVCFLFACLKKEVVCSYSSLQKFKLKYP